MTSNSLPFEIDDYTIQGTPGPNATPKHIVIIGPSRPQRRSYPLIDSVATFTAATPFAG